MSLFSKFKSIWANPEQKMAASLAWSIVVNLAFIAYNSYLGIKFADAFAIGISIYYFVLLWIRLASIIVERSIAKLGPEVKQRVRAKNYLVSSSLVFVLDLCLIAPIILMVVRPKAVAFGLIPAIAEATYCLYKIVAAIISYRRSKRSQNPTIVLQKEISIIGAIVSVLMLQRTLIEVTGGMNPAMQSLSLATSIGFLALIVVFSIVAFVKNKRIFELASTSSQH